MNFKWPRTKSLLIPHEPCGDFSSEEECRFARCWAAQLLFRSVGGYGQSIYDTVIALARFLR